MCAKNINKIFYVACCALMIGCGQGAGSSSQGAGSSSQGAGSSSQGNSNSQTDVLALKKSVAIDSYADFGPRDSASLVQYKDKAILFSGFYSGSGVYQDFWSTSNNGESWVFLTGNIKPINYFPTTPVYYESQYLPPFYSALASFGGKIIAVGIDGNVWASENGVDWSIISSQGPRLPSRSHNKMLVYNDKLYYIGADVGSVWETADGITWIENKIKDAKNFAYTICNATSVATDKMYIFGGVNCDDNSYNKKVLFSGDGKSWNWIESDGASVEVPWIGRQWPCSTVDDQNTTWMIGGYNNEKQGINLNDVWFTTDFYHWNRLVESADDLNEKALWPRHASACTYIKGANKILVVGGKVGPVPNNDFADVTSQVIAVYTDRR